MAAKHAHRWQRLSDVALFCQCGQTKEVGAPVYPVHLCSHPCTLLHYPAYPNHWYPVQPYVWPTVYWGTTTGDVTTSFIADGTSDDNVTYTAIGMTA